MGEDKTREIKNGRSFEERVFARFDAIDVRFDGVDQRFERVEGRLSAVEIKITKLESQRYDTKPIWEQALAAIAETNNVMREGFESLGKDLRAEFQLGNAKLGDSLRAEFQAGNAKLGDSLRAEFQASNAELRAEFQAGNAELRDSLRAEMHTGFTEIRKDMEHALRGVERKLDALNHNILELQGDQRYVDRRLMEIETQIKPS